MALSKIQKGLIDKEIINIKNTYPKMRLIEPEEFGRLFKPDIFEYSNKPRLYRTVTDKILQSLLDFHYAFRNLPESYKKEIIASPEFSGFMTNIFSVGITEIKKKEEEEQYPKIKDEEPNNNTIDIYQKFFNIGLEGLIETLPHDFSFYLKGQMKPLLLLMLAISKTSKLKINVQLNFPEWVYHDRNSSVLDI